MIEDTEYTCFWGAGDYSQMPDEKLIKLYRDADREADKMAAEDAWWVDRMEQNELLNSLRAELDKRGINPWED